MKTTFLITMVLLTTIPVMAECPPADLTGDCYVDLADFAEFSAQWLFGVKIPVDMVSIPDGTFQMGNSTDYSEGDGDELPVHTVTLSPFYMGKYEITNGQYCEFLNSALSLGLVTVNSDGVIYQAGMGTSYPYCGTSASNSASSIAYAEGNFSVRTKNARSMVNDPMVLVSWYGAVAYCNWRSQQEGYEQCYDLSTWECDFSNKGYRLPTEAQWEYAARGGLEGKRFSWGDTITHIQANYKSVWKDGIPFWPYDISQTNDIHPAWADGRDPHTSPVGSFSANGYGLYDMVGNVREWCNDWYEGTYYSSSASNNPTGPSTGAIRAIRNGNWSLEVFLCRVAYRDSSDPENLGNGLGFRVVLNIH